MSRSGALFYLDKLNDVSRTEISKLSAEDCFKFLSGWVEEFGTEKDKAHFKDREYIVKILNLVMGTGGKKRRKDIERAEQGVRLIDYFFDDTFSPEYAYRYEGATVNRVLDEFANIYDVQDDNSAWFAKVKAVASNCGFASEMSDYKAHPENYKGSVTDVAEILRIAVTGSPNSPDLCTIMGILGKVRTVKRLSNAKIK